MDNTCTLAHVFVFQTSLHAAAQNAEVCPFSMSVAGRICGWRTCSSPKSGSENLPNSLNAMTTTKSEIINHATHDGSVRSDLSRHLLAAALGLAVLLAGPGALRAGNLYVPNYSFESPDIGTNSPTLPQSWIPGSNRPSRPGMFRPISAARRGRIWWAHSTISPISPIPSPRIPLTLTTATESRRRSCSPFRRLRSFRTSTPLSTPAKPTH